MALALNGHPHFDDDALHREYQHWIKVAGDDSLRPYGMGVHDVLRGHFLLLDYFSLTPGNTVGGIGPRDHDMALLQSAVSRQWVSFGGIRKYKTPFELVATLFYGLVQNHPFHDANKRTALLVAIYQLLQCGRTPSTKQAELDKLAVRTAAHELHKYPRYAKFNAMPQGDADVAFLADYLHTITRKVDTRQYFITFQQLDTILQSHGFQFDNHSGNCIDVVALRTKKRLLRKPVTEKVFVCQVGCPTMKAQVGANALKTVRRATGLTPENGVDSQVFFRGQDSLGALVSLYESPLRRLARK